MRPLLYALLPRPPHPTRDGGAIRAYFLLRALSGEFRVRAFVLRSNSRGSDGDYPPEIQVCEIPHAGRAPRRALAVARSLAGGAAYSELLYRSRRLSRELRQALSRDRPDWVVAFFYHLGGLAVRQEAPSWIDFQNVDSQIWARVARTSTSQFARWFARGQTPRVQALERRLLSMARGVSCVSVLDAGALSAMSPGARPLVVPNGVDLSRYRFRAEPRPDKLLFFVGDLSWPPEAEGIRWFRAEVWPLLKRHHPDARVEVLGRGAPADLRRLSEPDFRLLGEGGDTRPYWERAAVAVVPLRAGGGTRLKILEAAACGVPAVSTPVGAEGLELAPGAEIAIGADAVSFADETARLLSDPEARRRQAAAARRRIEAAYDWTPIGAAFALVRRRRSSTA
jgi:glycosyltransferase involved in cell wall biosynthesis